MVKFTVSVTSARGAFVALLFIGNAWSEQVQVHTPKKNLPAHQTVAQSKNPDKDASAATADASLVRKKAEMNYADSTAVSSTSKKTAAKASKHATKKASARPSSDAVE
jgi:4-amino-4-deoxy-L-arabinose transferase-like glycosyltransferase